jgi:hypothetical protein
MKQFPRGKGTEMDKKWTSARIDALVVGWKMDALVERVVFNREVTKRACCFGRRDMVWYEVESFYAGDPAGLEQVRSEAKRNKGPDPLPTKHAFLPCRRNPVDQSWEVVSEYSRSLDTAMPILVKMDFPFLWRVVDIWHTKIASEHGREFDACSPRAAEAVCRAALKVRLL